jgi:hypothetical protein
MSQAFSVKKQPTWHYLLAETIKGLFFGALVGGWIYFALTHL